MGKQRDTPLKSREIQSAQKIAAILKCLPEQERLRLEGVIIGMGLAHKSASQSTDRTA